MVNKQYKIYHHQHNNNEKNFSLYNNNNSSIDSNTLTPSTSRYPVAATTSITGSCSQQNQHHYNDEEVLSNNNKNKIQNLNLCHHQQETNKNITATGANSDGNSNNIIRSYRQNIKSMFSSQNHRHNHNNSNDNNDVNTNKSQINSKLSHYNNSNSTNNNDHDDIKDKDDANADDYDNASTLERNFNDISIHNVGRFQYILQMNKELGCNSDDKFYNLNLPKTIEITKHSSLASSSTESSTTTTATTATITYLTQGDKIRQHFKKYCKYMKWPIIFTIIGIILVIPILFLLFGQNNHKENLNEIYKNMINSSTLSPSENLLNSKNLKEIDNKIDNNNNNQNDEILAIYIKNQKIPIEIATDATIIATTSNYPKPIRVTNTVSTLIPTIVTATETFRNSVPTKVIKPLQTVVLLSAINSKPDNNDVITLIPSINFGPTRTMKLIPSIKVEIFKNIDKFSADDYNDNDNEEVLTISSKISNDDDSNSKNEDNVKSTTKTLKEQFKTIIGFTSGHQNNFGIPIEEDQRILKLLLNSNNSKNNNYEHQNDKKDNKSSTNYFDHHHHHSITKVSPTLPTKIPSIAIENKNFKNNSSIMDNDNDDNEICESTSLKICQGVLQYDLTINLKNIKNHTVKQQYQKFTDDNYEDFKYLINTKCSNRTAEFICSILEPECRPSQMGILQPCKRICKSILESCSDIIINSEVLTTIFDCDQYPDSNDRNICEDPTRRNNQCYINEFKCYDSTCIPLRWRCDNIKDCSYGEDEDNCLLCNHEEFRCYSNDKCIPNEWKCDQNDDCLDKSDELDCYYDDEEYGLNVGNDSSDDGDSDGGGNIDYEEIFNSTKINIFLPLLTSNSNNNNDDYAFSSNDDNDGGIGSYLTINGKNINFKNEKYDGNESNPIINGTDSVETTTIIDNVDLINKNKTKISNDKDIQKAEETDKILVPKNLVNFQDSKEILITSDSETDYKYSKVTTFTPHLYCPKNQLRCVSGKCITVDQICDRTIDCPDGADEAMCVYKNP